MEFSSLFETGLGNGVVVASPLGVSRVFLPQEDVLRHAGVVMTEPSELTERVAHMLMCYFNGDMQLFEKVPIDLHVTGSFRRHVLDTVRTIPPGGVRSYAQVACMAGSPGAARAVGGAMASNPVPIIIPCHRVVAADGRLTGFTAPGGLELKKFLLKMEGVEFKGERTLLKINVINR